MRSFILAAVFLLGFSRPVFGWTLMVENLTTNSVTYGSVYGIKIVIPVGIFQILGEAGQNVFSGAVGVSLCPAVLTNNFEFMVFNVAGTRAESGNYLTFNPQVPSVNAYLIDFTCGLCLAFFLGQAFKT